jgi:hypothetical protein
MSLVHSSAAAAIKASRRVAKAPLTWDPTGHLLSRFSFGPTPSSRGYADKHGADGWYAQQLRQATAHRGYTGNAGVARVTPLLNLNPYDLRQWLLARGDEYGWDAMDQLSWATLGLQGWSTAQLYETLVDFFANHLNVPNHNGDLWNTRHVFDRDVVRRYAMGKFSDMLLASAKSPAMLLYLNLAESTKAAVNENYGRELLELHTVGLRYSESDVQNCARMLTGRCVSDNQHYFYDAYIHPRGRIKVLGFTHPNTDPDAGEAAGDALLRYLAHHPYTAGNLARKLCMRFVSDTPSAALVNAVAAAYLKNDTSILSMVTTILHSTEFWESRGRKVRRPTENILATMRILGVTPRKWPDALGSLTWMTGQLGHQPLEWPAPNGYPDVAAAWRSAGGLLTLWDRHLSLPGGWDEFPLPALETLYGAARPATSGAAIDVLTRRLTGMTFAPAHKQALQSLLGEPATTRLADSQLQWWLQPMVGLILDSPHFALR